MFSQFFPKKKVQEKKEPWITLECVYNAHGRNGQWDRGCRAVRVHPMGNGTTDDMKKAISATITFIWYFLKYEPLFSDHPADAAPGDNSELWSRNYLEEQILKEITDLEVYSLRFPSGQCFSIKKIIA